MLGAVFGIFTVAAFLFGIASGTLPQIAHAGMEGAENAVKLTLSLAGMMCLWSGVMRVLDGMGGTKLLSALLSPLMRVAFPDAYRKKKGIKEISAAVSANLLGIGNAATPLAIAAMRALADGEEKKEVVSDDMATFTVLGTASPSLFPTTILALRTAAGSEKPFSILIPVWVGSVVCGAAAILFSRLFRIFGRGKGS